MKLFKKKYERSAWFKGLLLAEKLSSDGVADRDIKLAFGKEEWVGNDIGKDFKMITAKPGMESYFVGVGDYLSYRQKYLQ